MAFLATTGTAGVIDINGTVIVEILTFLIMLAVLARYVYPQVVRLAEARQRTIADQLSQAEKARAEAEARIKEAQANLDDARKTAQQVIDAANKSGEQLRQDLRQKAEEDARRIAESARQQIESERDKAIRSVRAEVADLVVQATEKVIGEALDERRHMALIQRSIEEVASGDGRS
ncbi:MAG TPA: F0F1 ATP synthase subunit B [Candidatus Dormibacteraeota bacterium]|nr:F0F1 ATP synthase subunit B [Candidatus Dormibacteraeota bacterium]